MSPRRLITRPRAIVLAFAVVLLGGLVLLLAAAGADQRSTAFSLDVPATSPVARLSHGHSVCQGPIAITAPSQRITVWAQRSSPASTRLAATVRAPRGGAVRARATLAPSAGQPGGVLPALGGRLDRTLAGGTVSLCLRAAGPGTTVLMGAPPTAGSGTLHGRGVAPGGPVALATLFGAPHSASLLSLLGTVFSRAALFHPTWIGAWTFWLLLAGLAVGAGLVLVSLLRAAAEDG